MLYLSHVIDDRFIRRLIELDSIWNESLLIQLIRQVSIIFCTLLLNGAVQVSLGELDSRCFVLNLRELVDPAWLCRFHWQHFKFLIVLEKRVAWVREVIIF